MTDGNCSCGGLQGPERLSSGLFRTWSTRNGLGALVILDVLNAIPRIRLDIAVPDDILNTEDDLIVMECELILPLLATLEVSRILSAFILFPVRIDVPVIGICFPVLIIFRKVPVVVI